jgi:5'-phosphate synthase pdxT subunit
MSPEIGVVGVQGDVREHVRALEEALDAEGLEGEAARIRGREDLEAVDGVVLPGGESTTISRLLGRFDLRETIRDRVRGEDLPVMGTCAGMILLASEGDDQVEETDTELLEVMDFKANRNYFGGQRESFQVPLELPDLEDAYEAVFVRAPVAEDVWGDATVRARLPAEVAGAARGAEAEEPPTVAVEQDNQVAYAFHPELSPDRRLHRRFVRRAARWSGAGQE